MAFRMQGVWKFFPQAKRLRWFHGKDNQSPFIASKWSSRGRKGLAFVIGIGGAMLAWNSISFASTKEKPDFTKEDVRTTPSSPETCCGVSGNFKKKRKWKKSMRKALLKLEQVKEEIGSPGLVCAVSVDGELVWDAALGFADVENGVRCQKDTIMRIASISKALTSIALGKLLQEDKFELDVPIQKYVDYFPEKSFDGERVTITPRMLMSHTSGVRHYEKELPSKKGETSDKETTNGTTKEKSNDKEKKTNKQDKRSANTVADEFKLKEYYIKDHYSTIEDAVKIFSEDPLLVKPGSKYLYTTHGWTLLSACVEKASGMDYLKYMKNMTYELGLGNTLVELNDPMIYNRSRNYTRDSKGKLQNTPYVDNSYKWAGGGFMSTVGDLVKIGNVMLYSYMEKKDAACLKGYLNEEIVRRMWSPDPVTIGETSRTYNDMGYGLGWTLLPSSAEFGCGRKSKFAAMHGGAAVGASSILLIVPRESSPEDSSSTRDSNVDNLEQRATVKDQSAEVNDTEKIGYNSTISMNQMHNVMEPRPEGVVVAIMVNMQNVGLVKTALEIAKLFSSQES